MNLRISNGKSNFKEGALNPRKRSFIFNENGFIVNHNFIFRRDILRGKEFDRII